MKSSNTKRTKQKKCRGFTLIELLIVISIISVLLGLLYGALERTQKFSRRVMAFTEIKNLETAFKQYYAQYNTWPSNDIANIQITSGQDSGFIIDRDMSDVLQGYRIDETNMDTLNPAAIPFIEFARYSTYDANGNGPPVNPFKSINNTAGDTSRSYHVLFDTNGDRQIIIKTDNGVTAPTEPIIASVVVWTYIPSSRTTNSQGTQQAITDTILGSWDSFAAK